MKIRSLIVVLLALGAIAVPAVQITFQVNMSAQIGLGNFDPAADSVVVAGDPLNSWSTTASPLTPSATDSNVWNGTFDVTATTGATVQYKFVMNTINAPIWEGQVGSGAGTGNRTFIFGGTNQTLPVVYFNNVTNSSTVTPQITFRVDTSVQAQQGNFDPSSGTVALAGEFNNWSTSATLLTNSLATPNLFQGTLTLTGAVNSAVNYKYVMNGTWEGNVGDNGTQNRTVLLTKTNQTPPVVFFNNQSAIPVPIPVTFAVDMAVQTAQGKFDPTADTVTLAGDLINNWNATSTPLTNNPSATNLWQGTIELSSSAGTTLSYKFVINGTTWESINNRAYMLTSTNAQTVPTAFFNDVDDLGTISIGLSTNKELNLTWTAGPLIRLQSTTDLRAGPWQDVANTLGQGSTTITPASGPAFFRLSGQ